MGYKCSVPGCTVGYTSNPKPKDVHLFALPNEGTPTRAVWIKIIKGIRENWTVCNSARVCSNHFRAEDFRKVTADRRGRTTAHSILSRQLKENAYPSIFGLKCTNMKIFSQSSKVQKL